MAARRLRLRRSCRRPPSRICRRAVQGSRESTLFMAEEFALNQIGGNSAAVYFDKRPLPAWAQVMYGSGDEFLAGSGFAANQNGRIAGSDLFYAPQNFLESGTPTDNLFEIMLCLDLLLEINVLDLQPVLELFDFSERRLKLIGGSFERLLGILALTNFLLHLVVQPGIFQRDRRLRRQRF